MTDDATLWQQFSQGDKLAFETIFTRYYQDLLVYGGKMVKDRQLPEDCIQELFLELWQSRSRLAAVISVKAYLFRALKFKLLRALKLQLKQTSLSDEGDELPEFSYEAVLIASQENRQQQERLLKVIRELTKRQQEAVFLRFYGHMNYTEISETMGISYQAAVNLISQSVRYLRENVSF